MNVGSQPKNIEEKKGKGVGECKKLKKGQQKELK